MGQTIYDFTENTSLGQNTVIPVYDPNGAFPQTRKAKLATIKAWLGITGGVPVKSGSGQYSIQTKETNGADASGIASVAFHTGIASGNHGMAWGEINEAQGENSTAFGVQSAAIGNDSCAQGVGCFSYGQGSHAQGEATEATGMASFSTGRQSNSYYDHSQAYSTGSLGQELKVMLMGESTDATPIYLSLAYGDTPQELDLVTANDPAIWNMYIRVVATDSAGGHHIDYMNCIYSKSLGTITNYSIDQHKTAGWNTVEMTPILSAGTIRLRCTGLAATNIKWVAQCNIIEIH